MFGLTPYNRRNVGVQKGARNPFDMESLFENFFNDSMLPSLYSHSNEMKVDIKDNEKEYVIDAELPGVKKDEINVELRDDRLTIAVQRNETAEEERDNYIRKERRSSAMSRTFWVENVKEEDINAKFENGILTISLPKLEKGKVREHRIDIK